MWVFDVKTQCNCETCVRFRYYREIGIPDDIREYIMELEMDVEYFKAILSGSWPSGKEIVERALEKYK